MLRRTWLMLSSASVGATLAVLALPGTALAHAELVSSDPVAGSILDASPRVVTLEFTEGVETGLGGIRLFDGAGARVEIGQTYHPDGRGSAVQADLPELDGGSYVVDWQVVSADSHPVRGAFTFQVGSEATLQEGILDEILGADTIGRPAGIALIVSRGLVTTSIAVTFGGLAVLGLGIVTMTSRLRKVVIAAALVGGVAGLLQLPLEVGYATGQSLSVVFDPDAWSAALDTRVGVAWLVRALVIGVVGTGLAILLAHRSAWWWRATWGVGLAAVGLSSAFGGHGATGRWETVGIITTVVHVAAMAIWLGGIAMVALTVRSLSVEALRRFSAVALVAMACIVASGAVQAIRQVGSFDALTGTWYGTLLLWKLALVGLVVAAATVARQLVGRAPLDRARLTRVVAMEVATAIVIVSVTSLLMGANPSQAQKSQPFSTELVDGSYFLNVSVDPGAVGRNEMHLYLSNAETSLIEPDEITVRIADPARDVAPIDLAVVRTGNNHYTAPDVVFPYPAQWELQVAARYGFDEANFVTTIPIS